MHRIPQGCGRIETTAQSPVHRQQLLPLEGFSSSKHCASVPGLSCVLHVQFHPFLMQSCSAFQALGAVFLELLLRDWVSNVGLS